MKKVIIGILMGIIFNLGFGFHIMPDGFEKRIDNGDGYQEFYFPNNSLETIRYKFSATPGSSVRKDMSQWVEFYPKVLTIKPGETGILKVYAKAPKTAEDGEYGFHLDSMPITVPKIGKDGKEIKANVGVKIRASIEMIGYVGDLKPILRVESYKIYEKDDKTKMDLNIRNMTPKRGVEYGVQIRGKNNTTVRKTIGRIYENQSMNITVDLDGMKKVHPYEIEIYEDINYTAISKIKI